MRVLIVAPSQVWSFVNAGLIDEGFAIDMASDVHAAIAAVKRNDYHAVIVDAGLEHVSEIRMLRPRPHVVLLESRTNRLGSLAEAEAVLTVPFRFDELLNTLESLVPRADAQAPKEGEASGSE